VRGGVTMVQLREKDTDTRSFLELALALKNLLRGRSIALVINDRMDIALAVNADGLHIGQNDMPLERARALMPHAFIGLSANTPAHLSAADAAQADYLGIGPLFAQTTKPDASMPLGVEGFAQLRAQTSKPLIAIGGIKPEHAKAIKAAGANGIAVVSALMSADDPMAVAQEFIRQF
jgi:thiamine-phosphate pyrophosphorylase